MRIELPLPTWAEFSQRAEDDAHTLTVAPPSPEWVGWQWACEPATTLRTEVDAEPGATLTLTLAL